MIELGYRISVCAVVAITGIGLTFLLLWMLDRRFHWYRRIDQYTNLLLYGILDKILEGRTESDPEKEMVNR